MSEDARDPDQTEPPAGASEAERRRLRVVSFEPHAAAGDAGGPLRLLREYKGPTVAGVLSASPAAIDRLPGRVCSVLDAIDRGDLADADRRLDAAIHVLPGPGSQRRRAALVRWPWIATAIAWAIAVAVTVIALGWG